LRNEILRFMFGKSKKANLQIREVKEHRDWQETRNAGLHYRPKYNVKEITSSSRTPGRSLSVSGGTQRSLVVSSLLHVRANDCDRIRWPSVSRGGPSWGSLRRANIG